MKTPRFLATFTTAFLFATSTPCFPEVAFISGNEDSGKVVITSKVLSRAEAKEMGMIFVAGKLDDDEISITLELKKEGMLKHFSSFKLSIRDGGNAVFEGALNSQIASKPDCALAVFTIRKSLLSKACLTIHADDERDPENGPYDDVHAGLYVLNLHEHVPADLLTKAGGPSAQAAQHSAPSAQLWPPPLDEKRLIGTWVRKNQPSQGVENHTLLILREDHSWNEAEISGPLTAPVRIKKFAPDSKWEVVNVGEKNNQAMLLFKHKEGGSNVWNILKVGAQELEFSGYGGAIIDFKHYTRCEAQTAAKLNEMLGKVIPGGP